MSLQAKLRNVNVTGVHWNIKDFDFEEGNLMDATVDAKRVFTTTYGTIVFWVQFVGGKRESPYLTVDIEVEFDVPEQDNEEVVQNEEKRNSLYKIVIEIALGQARTFTQMAFGLAGLKSPVTVPTLWQSEFRE